MKYALLFKRMFGLFKELPPRYYEMPANYKDSFYLANSSFFDSVNWYLHKAYEVVFPDLVSELMRISGIDERRASEKVLNLIEILDQCDYVADIKYPVKRKDGYLDLVRSFKVKYGSYVGFPSNILGLRISPDLTRDDLKGMGVLSTHTSCALGLKKVHSFGGIKIDFKGYEFEDLENIIENYGIKCWKEDNTGRFLVDCDLNYDEKIVDWFNQKYGYFECSELVDSQGAFFAINCFLNDELITSKLKFPKGIAGKTFIIQGLGMMGANLARYLESAGAVCVGVKELNCHIYNKEGLNVHKLLSFRRQHGDLSGFELANPQDNFEIYKEECDILILAAKQRTILCHFAKSIKAKLIVEAAYHPITPSAYMTLRAHSKVVLPDLLVCGGRAMVVNEGSLSSEMISQNLLQAVQLSKLKVIPSTYLIANVVNNKCQELMSICDQYNLGFDFKTAAFVMSIRNIFQEIFSSGRF